MGVIKLIRDGLSYPVRAVKARFKPHRPDVDVLRAAIAYAVEYPEGRSEGIEWLAAWQDGEPAAMAELAGNIPGCAGVCRRGASLVVTRPEGP